MITDDELTRQAIEALYPPRPKRTRWLAYFRTMREAEPARPRTRWNRKIRTPKHPGP